MRSAILVKDGEAVEGPGDYRAIRESFQKLREEGKFSRLEFWTSDRGRTKVVDLDRAKRSRKVLDRVLKEKADREAARQKASNPEAAEEAEAAKSKGPRKGAGR